MQLPEARIALVTGAGTGIGREVALALMRDGFTVVLAGRRREPLEQVAKEGSAFGADALPVTADISDPASVKSLFSRVTETFGRLDLLVNNAGISSPAVPLEDLAFDDWNKAISRRGQRGHRAHGADEDGRAAGRRLDGRGADHGCGARGPHCRLHGWPSPRREHTFPHCHGYSHALIGRG